MPSIGLDIPEIAFNISEFLKKVEKVCMAKHGEKIAPFNKW